MHARQSLRLLQKPASLVTASSDKISIHRYLWHAVSHLPVRQHKASRHPQLAHLFLALEAL